MDGLEEMPCDEKLYAYKGDRLVSYDGEEFVYDEIGNPTTYRGRSAVWSYGRLMGIDGNTERPSFPKNYANGIQSLFIFKVTQL
jgi:hypothetical protein